MKSGFALVAGVLVSIFLHGHAAANPCGDFGPYFDKHDHKSETSAVSVEVVVGHQPDVAAGEQVIHVVVPRAELESVFGAGVVIQPWQLVLFGIFLSLAFVSLPAWKRPERRKFVLVGATASVFAFALAANCGGNQVKTATATAAVSNRTGSVQAKIIISAMDGDDGAVMTIPNSVLQSLSSD